MEKRSLSFQFQVPAALSNEGWAEKLAFTSFLIRALRRARQQLPGCPLPCPDRARAQTVQTSEPVEPLASGQTPCMSARGWGVRSGFPCPRHYANMWKVELTPGGMPRAHRVGICWHGII